MKFHLKKRIAFTLAETLITLGIIGIVAAITLPTLISNYQKHVTLVKVKKAFTTLNNAIEMAKVYYGTNIDNWEIIAPTEDDKYTGSKHFAKTYLIPYLNITKECENTDTDCQITDLKLINGNLDNTVINELPEEGYSFILNNGTLVNAYTEIKNEKVRVHLYFDINGLKGPNRWGRDFFRIELGGNLNATDRNINKFLPYGFDSQATISSYMASTGVESCHKGDGQRGGMCLAAIYANNWELPPNYPW